MTATPKWVQIDYRGDAVMEGGYCKPRYDRIGLQITDILELEQLSRYRKSIAIKTDHRSSNGERIFILKPALRVLMMKAERVLSEFGSGKYFYYDAVNPIQK